MTRQLFAFASTIVMAMSAAAAAGADRPVPDVPFPQEYRDPFVRGETADENDVRAVAVDGDGRVWAATAAGVRVVDNGRLTAAAGIDVGGPAYAVCLDRQGALWIGAWDGLYRVEQGAMSRVAGPQGPVTVVSARDARVLVGSVRVLIHTYPPDRVSAPDAQVLVGSAQGTHEYADGEWNELSGPWSTPVCDLAVADGSLYVAAGSGLYRVESDAMQRIAIIRPLLSRNLSALAVGPGGAVWIGSRGGIDVYRAGRRTASITGRSGLPSTDVRSLDFDADGVLWAGTGLGVARYDGRQWSLRHSQRWLPHDEVRGVAFESDGSAWIATRGGLSVIRKRSMTLADKAAHFQQLVRERHVRAPGLVEVCRLRTPGDLSTWEAADTDNDGLFTGLYLAAEAYRYAVTGAADARENATEAYRAMEFLQTVTGTEGFVARTVVPSDWRSMADANRTYTDLETAEHRARDPRWKKVEQRWRPSADGKWLWKGDTSSDEITGHFYAYGVYYDLVADDAEKQRVAAHVRRIINYIIDGGYVLRDIDGESTRWGVWSPERLNDDPNWWTERGCNSVEILSYLTVARHVTGDEKYDREIETLLEQHRYAENILTPMQPGADYFTYIGYQLLAMSYPALLAHEPNPQRRELYLQSLERWFAPVRNDASPFYGFVYGAAGQGDFRQHECVELLRDVPLDMIEWTVDNSRRQDIQLVERPVEGSVQTDRLLPPSERGIFRWDRNVYEAQRGAGGHSEGSSVFWLAPYWMGRYHGFIGEPET